MKARKVKGLDADAPLADNAERLVLARLDECYAFMPAAADPAAVVALHDLRIAAKRLRYLLELLRPALGPYAKPAAKRVKELQDLLGRIHDCDMTVPRVEALIAELRRRDALELQALAADAGDLDPELLTVAAHAEAFRGLEALAVYLRARRAVLFGRFLEAWEALERAGFRARLEYAAAERPSVPPAITPRSHDGNRAAPSDDLPSDLSPT
jgi:CHAD domain-containing protein